MKNKSLLAAMLLMVTSSVMFVSCYPPIMDWAPIEIYVRFPMQKGKTYLILPL